MLPLRHGLGLGLLLALAAGWLMLHNAGYQQARFYQRVSASCEKYGLRGHAAALRVAAARASLQTAAGAAEANLAAARVAGDFAADQFVHAARLLGPRNDDPAPTHPHAPCDAADHALSLLHSAQQAAPWRKDVRVRVLEAQLAAGDEGALRRLSDLAYREDDPDAQLGLARLRAAEGDWDDALALLGHAARNAPEHLHVRLGLAQALLALGEPQDALEHALVAHGLATGIGERLAAAELVRAAGGEAPSRDDMLWEHRREEYLPTALVVAVYLLILCLPGLLHVTRLRRQ